MLRHLLAKGFKVSSKGLIQPADTVVGRAAAHAQKLHLVGIAGHVITLHHWCAVFVGTSVCVWPNMGA